MLSMCCYAELSGGCGGGACPPPQPMFKTGTGAGISAPTARHAVDQGSPPPTELLCRMVSYHLHSSHSGHRLSRSCNRSMPFVLSTRLILPRLVCCAMPHLRSWLQFCCICLGSALTLQWIQLLSKILQAVQLPLAYYLYYHTSSENARAFCKK